MNSKPQNQNAAQMLAKSFSSHQVFDIRDAESKMNNLKDNQCFVIDIDASCGFSEFTADFFARQLMQCHLPSTVKDIYMIVSDMKSHHAIMTFAQGLSIAFARDYQKKINIHVVSSLNFDVTLIVPSEKNNKWVVYGFDDTENSFESYDDANVIQNKKILFEGENILDWMDNNQRILNGINYVWSE